MKVLIIDNDPSLQIMLSEVCKVAGWTPLVAENGVKALPVVEKENPDIILVDYHMPEMNGLETVKAIRKKGISTPILVLTVDERQEVADDFLNAGATDFALKPVKAPDIISRIQLHMRLANLTTTKESNEDVFVAKGISKTTLSYIVNYFKSRNEPSSVDEIAKEVDLAYPTVYRYVMHLLDEEKIRQEESYQKIGRPKKLYQWFIQ